MDDELDASSPPKRPRYDPAAGFSYKITDAINESSSVANKQLKDASSSMQGDREERANADDVRLSTQNPVYHDCMNQQIMNQTGAWQSQNAEVALQSKSRSRSYPFSTNASRPRPTTEPQMDASSTSDWMNLSTEGTARVIQNLSGYQHYPNGRQVDMHQNIDRVRILRQPANPTDPAPSSSNTMNSCAGSYRSDANYPAYHPLQHYPNGRQSEGNENLGWPLNATSRCLAIPTVNFRRNAKRKKRYNRVNYPFQCLDHFYGKHAFQGTQSMGYYQCAIDVRGFHRYPIEVRCCNDRHFSISSERIGKRTFGNIGIFLEGSFQFPRPIYTSTFQYWMDYTGYLIVQAKLQ